VHLARDYIHPYKDAGGRPAHCRVRIYLPDALRDAPVVICSELPNNPGGSITNSAEVIAAGVVRANELPTPLVWIEHWPEESREGEESFELVVFSSYEVVERTPYLPWGDESVDRRRHMEDTGPYISGVDGRWEGIGRWVSRGTAVAMVL
jgi:hypothetical protein